MTRSRLTALLGAALVFAATLASAQSDPLLGKFTLNVSKSKYSPGPPPKSETRTYEVYNGSGVKARFDRVAADGKTLTVTYSAMYDGKDYPYVGSPDADTIALRKVDSRTVDATLKKAGKTVQTTHAVLSADGKTRTLVTTGTNAAGARINNTTVFDRQ